MQLDAALLGDERAAVGAEHLDVRLALPVHPEIGALVHRSVGVVGQGVGAHDHDARLVAGQVIGIGDHRDHVHGAVSVVDIVEVALGVHVGFQIALAVHPRAQDGGLRHGDRRGEGRVALVGIGVVQRVVGAAAGGHRQADLQHLPAAEQSAVGGVDRHRRAAVVGRAAVGRLRRGRGEVPQHPFAGAAVGQILILQRHEHAVEDRAVRLREHHAVAAVHGELEAGVAPPVGHGVAAVAHHAQELTGLNDRALGELPLAGPGRLVRKAEAGQVHRLASAVIQLDPVAAGGAAGHDLADHHAVAVHAQDGARRGVRAGEAVGLTRRGREGLGPAGLQLGIGLIRFQRGDGHIGGGHAPGIGQEHLVAVAGDLEGGVQMGHVRAAVVAGAVHRDVAARGQHHRREAPAHELFLAVGKPPALQVHRIAGNVVDLHIVPVRAVFIGIEGGVLGHDLRDLQRVRHHREGRGRDDGLAGVPLGPVDLAGRRKIADLPHPGDVAAIALVPVHGRHIHRVDHPAPPVQQGKRLAGGRQPVGRVIAVGLGGLGAAVAVDHHVIPRLDHPAGKGKRLGGLGGTHQRIARQIDGTLRCILDLNPVGDAAFLADQHRGVGRHDFADAKRRLPLRRRADHRAARDQPDGQRQRRAQYQCQRTLSRGKSGPLGSLSSHKSASIRRCVSEIPNEYNTPRRLSGDGVFLTDP